MNTIWRIPAIKGETGKSRTSLYEDIKAGLLTRPIKLGARAVGIPADEVRAINAARIAGKSNDEIKALVRKLEAARRLAT